jgi:hypothetical protein
MKIVTTNTIKVLFCMKYRYDFIRPCICSTESDIFRTFLCTDKFIMQCRSKVPRPRFTALLRCARS